MTAKRVTPHTLRHTNAMLLRAKGVDIATIALWLGHESTQTTHIYEHADPALKEQAIARTAPLGTKPGRYRLNRAGFDGGSGVLSASQDLIGLAGRVEAVLGCF